jgi:hypothetical protein
MTGSRTLPSPALAVAALCTLAFAWLLHRHLGLNPAVFADEWYYSKMARLAALDQAEVPSWLYLWLFGASKACGERFLDCARVGNTLLFVAATPFIYLSARAFTTPRLALLVAGLALLAPANLYTAFFMPETMYYLGFWVLSWLALTRSAWPAAQSALACGAVLGLLSLVKVHALFLLPALCLFLLLHTRLSLERPPWLGRAVVAMAVALGVTFAVKFALGWLLAGQAGLSLFGSLYETSASRSSHRALLALAGPAFGNLRGHLMAMAILFALPLALSMHGLASRALRDAAPALVRLQAYALLMLGAALGMTVLYTASIAAPDNDDAIRLHLRYYNFVFPLLLMVCAAWITMPHEPRPASARTVLMALLAALMGLGVATLPNYSLSMVDGPDIAAIGMRSLPGLLVPALQLLVLVLWARGSARAPRVFLFALAPLVLMLTVRAEQRFTHQLVPSPDFYADEAARVALRTIPNDELGQTTLAGTGMAELYRMQFHVDDLRVHLLDLPAGMPVDPALVEPGSKWLLVAGQHALPRGFKLVTAGLHYQLAQVLPRGRAVGSARLGGALPNGMVQAAQGLSVPEGWGRWSDGKHVMIHLVTPLPPHATIVLTASAYGPNVKLPFTLRAGGGAVQFSVGTRLRPVDVHVDTDGDAQDLVIDVPQPISPSMLGQSPDQRKLGLALARIDVFENPPDGLSETTPSGTRMHP